MGIFDSAGERLYREMDRAMRDLNSANPSLKGEILAKTERLISNIQAESERWSADGKRKAARHLQAEAKRQRDFDIASYTTQFFAGAWLEAGLLPDDKHAAHVRKTIELLLDESQTKSSGAASSGHESTDMGPLVQMCFTAVLAVYLAEQTTDLDYLLRSLEELGQPVVDQAHAIAFGLVDGAAQLKRMSQTEHLATATMFFLTYVTNDPSAAADIVGKLIRVRPGHDLFELIRAGSKAMISFKTTQDMNEFMNLASLLDCPF